MSPEELQTWLEWAGARLIAMPSIGLKPAEPKVIWPDYAQDSNEITKFRGRLPLRVAAPAKHEVAMVDKILLLPNIIDKAMTRRVVHARALVHPINYRHLYSWRRIGKLLHTSGPTVKLWHKTGLNQIITKTDSETLTEIANFMHENLAQ